MISILIDGTVQVQGTLHDGREIQYTVDPELPPHDLIGAAEPEVLADGTPNVGRRFVKARLAESGDLLMCRVDGFKVEYSTLPYAAAHAHLGLPSPPERTGNGVCHQFSENSNDDKPGMTDGYAASRLDALLDLFLQIDVDGNGQLEPPEVVAALRTKPDLARVILGAVARQ